MTALYSSLEGLQKSINQTIFLKIILYVSTIEFANGLGDLGSIPGRVIFTNPSARAGYDTRSIFKRILTGLNSVFLLLE